MGMQARQYRNYLYREVPSAHLDWEHRLDAILSELDHWSPDVICLQVMGLPHHSTTHSVICKAIIGAAAWPAWG